MYKEIRSFEARLQESEQMKRRFPDRVPIIVERRKPTIPEIDKHKFMVPLEMTAAQFIFVIRKRLQMKAESALFLFCNQTMLSGSMCISHICSNNLDADGFLYVLYDLENTFGV